MYFDTKNKSGSTDGLHIWNKYELGKRKPHNLNRCHENWTGQMAIDMIEQ